MNTPLNVTLTETVIDSIRIESFIYHIIRKDTAEPDYNDEVILDPEQKRFFEGRIRFACEGTQFEFSDVENNTCKRDCSDILSDVSRNLIPISRQLTARFFEAHNRSTSEGIFIVAVFSLIINQQRHSMLSFLKVDYSTVFQQEINDVQGRKSVTLHKVIDSLSDNPHTLQKWAIIDTSDMFAWDVLALQRRTSEDLKDTDKAISSYFKGFLQVGVRSTPGSLTKESVRVAHDWAQGIDDLPEGMSRSDYKARAITYFENSDLFNTSDYINQVLGSYIDEDMAELEQQQRINTRDGHETALRNILAENGIAGQVFESSPGSISAKSKRTTLKTTTGAKVVYQGTRKLNNIVVTSDGGEQVITIRTTQLDEI